MLITFAVQLNWPERYGKSVSLLNRNQTQQRLKRSNDSYDSLYNYVLVPVCDIEKLVRKYPVKPSILYFTRIHIDFTPKIYH